MNDDFGDDRDDDRSYAVAVALGDGGWTVSELPDEALDDLDAAVSATRRLRAERASFAMLNVDDDYFILLRPVPGAVRAVLSDATAAVTDDIDAWPEGDLALLADVGMPEDMLAVICEDQSLWACEQLHVIADHLGFADELAEVTGVDVDDLDG